MLRDTIKRWFSRKESTQTKQRGRLPNPDIATRNATLCSLYRDGLTVQQVAARTEVNKRTVYFALRSGGVKLRPRPSRKTGPQDTGRTAEIVRLREEEHLTYRQIGARYGISHERVRQILEKAGVDTRASFNRRSRAINKKYQSRTCGICGNELPSTSESSMTAKKEHIRLYHRPLMNLGARSTAEQNATRAAIAEDYVAGVPEVAIREKYGVNPTTITYALLQTGRTRNRRPQKRMKTRAESEARKKAIVADARAGLPLTQVASKHGVSISWVSLILRNNR